MTIQQAIGKHRRDSGLSQLELARRSGVPCRNINLWESGGGNPSFNDCLRLAAGLEISIEQLATGVALPEGGENRRRKAFK